MSVRVIPGNAQQCFVRLRRSPVAMESQEHLEPGDWRYAFVEKALNGGLMGSWTYVPACIDDHKNFITELSCLFGAGGDAEVGPQTGDHQLIAAYPLHRGEKPGVFKEA